MGYTPAYAGCSSVKLIYNKSEVDDDEYLYMNKEQHELALEGYKSYKTSGRGIGYECDKYNSGACTTDDKVTLPAGHWFMGEEVNKTQTYACKTWKEGNDKWVPIEHDVVKQCTFIDGKRYDIGASIEIDCSKIPPKGLPSAADARTGDKCHLSCMKTRSDGSAKSYWSVKECLPGVPPVEFSESDQIYTEKIPGYKKCSKNGDEGCPDGEKRATKNLQITQVNCDGNVCKPIYLGQCYPEKMLSCYEAIDNGEKAVWNGAKCLCVGTKMELDYKTKKCSVADNLCQRLEKKNATAERLACCHAGKETKWVDANGGDATNSVGQTGEYCKCKDDNMEWSYDATSKTGKCEKQEPELPGNGEGRFEGQTCWYSFEVNVICNGQKFVLKEKIDITDIVLSKDLCANKRALKDKFEGEIHKKVEAYAKNWVKERCENGEVIVSGGRYNAELNRAKAKLDALFGGKRTVWRTEEGKFNTARLASDATAGVVLGTVGGIVSGKVIKKKQLEKGFDALQCTVGGQKMADYGDTFQVTFRR